MKNSMTLLSVTVLFLLGFAGNTYGQDKSSLKEQGYEPIVINAKYAFYNDLSELTNGGVFENVTAGFRKLDGSYEILIDFGWTKEIIYVDFIEFSDAGPVANGLDYQRSVYGDGREEVLLSVHIGSRMAFYSSEKTFIP